MRKSFSVLFILICIFMLGVVASADNQLGIADKYKVTFSENVRVANTLLPKGNYEILHVMEGTDHIMVFRQVGTKKPVEVRAKCTLVPLGAKATDDQRIYIVNAANERVLQELIFKGDRSAHMF
jgi:hypothetical protein